MKNKFREFNFKIHIRRSIFSISEKRKKKHLDGNFYEFPRNPLKILQYFPNSVLSSLFYRPRYCTNNSITSLWEIALYQIGRAKVSKLTVNSPPFNCPLENMDAPRLTVANYRDYFVGVLVSDVIGNSWALYEHDKRRVRSPVWIIYFRLFPPLTLQSELDSFIIVPPSPRVDTKFSPFFFFFLYRNKFLRCWYKSYRR